MIKVVIENAGASAGNMTGNVGMDLPQKESTTKKARF